MLAALGVYGVFAYAVTHRRREIGVRMALGARFVDVLGMLLRQGGIMVGVGLAAGVALAALAAGMLESLASSSGAIEALLYKVDAFDATTFATVPLLLGLIAMLAIVIPARRAGRIDPVEALRAE